MVIALCVVSNLANAAEVADTVVVRDTVYAQTARQSAMTMFGHGNSKGCGHVGIYADNAENRAKGRVGKLWMENCNGWQLSAGPEVQFCHAESELGEFDNTVVGGRVAVGYEYYWLTPSVSYFKGSTMTIEDRSVKTDEFTASLNVFPFRHSIVSPGIGVNYTHRLLRSRKEVSLEGYELNLPYKGKAGSIGVEASLDIRLGHTSHNRTFSDGEYSYKYEKRGELDLRITGRYNHFNVEKLKSEQSESNLKLNVVSISATLVWRLP